MPVLSDLDELIAVGETLDSTDLFYVEHVNTGGTILDYKLSFAHLLSAVGYTLPIASAITLGGFKVGTNFAIDGAGTLTLRPATLLLLGGVFPDGVHTTVDIAGTLGLLNVATLDAAGANIGRVPLTQLPTSLANGWYAAGSWNATTNIPAFASSTAPAGQRAGAIYVVTAAGTTALDGYAQWGVGDKLLWDGTTWERIEGDSTEVTTVAGRVGAVVLTTADIGGLSSMAGMAVPGAGIVTSNGTILSNIAVPGAGIVTSDGTILANMAVPAAGLVTSNGTILSNQAVPAAGIVISNGTTLAAGALNVNHFDTLSAGVTLSLAPSVTLTAPSGSFTPLVILGNSGGGPSFGGAPPQTNVYLAGPLIGFPTVIFDGANVGNAGGGLMLGRRSRGQRSSPVAVQTGDTLFTIGGAGWNGSAISVNPAAQVNMVAAEAHTPLASGGGVRMSVIRLGTTATVDKVFEINSGTLTILPAAASINGRQIASQDTTGANIGRLPFTQLPTEVQNMPIAAQQNGTMADAQIMLLVPANETLVLPTGLVGAGIIFNNGTTGPTGGWPAATDTFVVSSNNGTVWAAQGTLSVSTLGVLTIVSGPTADVTIAPGGGVRVIAQATHDTNMKDFALTLMLKKV